MTAQEWLTKPGTVGKAWPISEIAIFDDEGNKVEEPNVIGTVYMSMQTGDFEYHKDEKKTEEQPDRQVLHRRATSDSSTRTATSSSGTARST